MTDLDSRSRPAILKQEQQQQPKQQAQTSTNTAKMTIPSSPTAVPSTKWGAKLTLPSCSVRQEYEHAFFLDGNDAAKFFTQAERKQAAGDPFSKRDNFW